MTPAFFRNNEECEPEPKQNVVDLGKGGRFCSIPSWSDFGSHRSGHSIRSDQTCMSGMSKKD